MKALFCYSSDDFRVEDTEKPAISENEMLVEMLYCGLCGSDIVKIFDPSFKKPAILGHEVVGRVVKSGKAVGKFKEGDIVVAAHHIPCGSCHYCIHGNPTMCSKFKSTNIVPGGFCQYIKLSRDHINNTTFPIPGEKDLLQAVFIEPLACCIRAMERAFYLEGDTFSVVGTGAIGMLFLQLIKRNKLKAVAIDLDDQRLLMAKKLGSDFTLNPSKECVSVRLKAIFPKGIDTAILTVTNRETLTEALSSVRPGGQIIIFGMGIETSTIPVDFNIIYKNELTIKSSYSATPETLREAYDMILSGKIDVSPLVSAPTPLSDFKKGLDLMLGRKIYKAIYRGFF